MGSGVGTIQLMKMVAGAINPGRPVANLYVSNTKSHPKRVFSAVSQVFYVES